MRVRKTDAKTAGPAKPASTEWDRNEGQCCCLVALLRPHARDIQPATTPISIPRNGQDDSMTLRRKLSGIRTRSVSPLPSCSQIRLSTNALTVLATPSEVPNATAAGLGLSHRANARERPEAGTSGTRNSCGEPAERRTASAAR